MGVRGRGENCLLATFESKNVRQIFIQIGRFVLVSLVKFAEIIRLPRKILRPVRLRSSEMAIVGRH